jgi:hypothetical protein
VCVCVCVCVLGLTCICMFPYEGLSVFSPKTVFSKKTPTKLPVSAFSKTVVPPYPLIQYPRFQLSTVYRGPKRMKIKEINGS